MNMNEKIKYLRKANGLTLEQVGNIVGVGKSTVRKWETGQIANMGRDKIAKLAVALNTTPAYLMGWTEENKEAPTPEGYVSFLGRDGKNKVIKATPELIALLETLPGSDDDF